MSKHILFLLLISLMICCLLFFGLTNYIMLHDIIHWIAFMIGSGLMGFFMGLGTKCFLDNG